MRLKNLLFFGSAVVATGILAFSSFPAGVPGEWEWGRHAPLLSRVDRWLLPAIAALVVAGIGLSVDRQFRRWGVIRRTTAVLLLVPLSGIWLSLVQLSTPAEYLLLRDSWVLYDPGSSGYFHKAVYGMEPVDEFLASYESLVNEGDVLHIGTHPPGLFLVSQWAIQLCHDSPELTKLLLPGPEVRDAFNQLRSLSGHGRALQPAEWAGLQLIGLLTRAGASLTVIPITLLVGQLFGAQSAWRVGVLWCTLPCLAVFLPKSDVFFTFTSATAVLLYVMSIGRGGRLWLAVPCGVIIWLGMLLSLAHVTLLALFATCCGIIFLADRTNVRPLAALGIVCGSIAVCSAVFTTVSDCNLFAVWKQNLSNHAGFYDRFPRTWWKWLIVNPIELACAIGLPVSIAVVSGARRTLTPYRLTDDTSEEPSGSHRMATVVLTSAFITWGVLWLSGKNQGEAARLWCFLTPWILIATGGLWNSDEDQKAQQKYTEFPYGWLLVSQLVCAIFTVGSICGFDALQP